MNVLGIGPAELLLVFILALIFIGPGKMPEVAASLGKAIREFQRASAELTDALNSEIAAAQAQKVASQVSENGRSQETEAAEEAEVVAQTFPNEVEPTAYAGASLSLEPAAPTLEDVRQPADGELEPQVEMAEPSEEGTGAQMPGVGLSASQSESLERAELYGLDPLPSSLLAPSVSERHPSSALAASADVVSSLTEAPEAGKAETSTTGRDGDAPMDDATSAPGAREPAATAAERGSDEAVAGRAGQAEV